MNHGKATGIMLEVWYVKNTERSVDIEAGEDRMEWG